MHQDYTAPWSRTLRVATILSVAILLLIALLGAFTGPRQLLIWRLAMIAIPLTVLVAALPFMVLGYRLTDDEIIVKRPGWSTTLPLAGLKDVGANAELLQASFRLFGNGGLFSITGWFWNRRLGRYRAYATDPYRAVVLEYPDRKVVITPHDPQGFVMRAKTLLSMR